MTTLGGLLAGCALVAGCADQGFVPPDAARPPPPDRTIRADRPAPRPDLPRPRGSTLCATIEQAPDKVLFRGTQRSFNAHHYGVVCGKQIYLRPNSERTGKSGPWSKLTQLPPALAGDVAGISLDDRFLMAVNGKGLLWQLVGADGAADKIKVNEYRGVPFGMGAQNRLPADTLAWDQSSVSPAQDGHYTDPAGNTHPVGWATCSHLMVLRKSGRNIAFNDAWLPADLDYEVCGPRRGRFVSVSMSASGATYFLINKYGDMYTRLWDWDLSGPNTVFYRYSYETQKGVFFPAIQLPPEAWRLQPKIEGKITDRISIHKVEKNCIKRVLRVEGMDQKGRTGYFTKDISQKAWRFVYTGHTVVGRWLDNRSGDSSALGLATAEDASYSRNIKDVSSLLTKPKGTTLGDDEWAGELLDFNAYCSPVALRVTLSKADTMDLLLHTTETLRLDSRPTRGLTAVPRPKNGTVEVPAALWAKRATLSQKAKLFIKTCLKDKRFTALEVKASSTTVTLGKGSAAWTFSR